MYYVLCRNNLDDQSEQQTSLANLELVVKPNMMAVANSKDGSGDVTTDETTVDQTTPRKKSNGMLARWNVFFGLCLGWQQKFEVKWSQVINLNF